VLPFNRLPLSRRSELPQYSGVYYACYRRRVLYVGKAVNLRHRWGSHHKLDELPSDAYLRWRWVPRYKLASVEAWEINRLKPPLNEVCPHPYPSLGEWLELLIKVGLGVWLINLLWGR
jgi:hypothetical protein